MKNRYIIILILTFISLVGMGQQMALQSQYMVNKFTINPAFAGTQKGIPIHLGVRRQWSAIKEAPVTQYLSANLALGGGLGAGATLYNEVSGPTRRTGLGLSAAYQFSLAKSGDNDHQLSLGLSGILSQHVLDKKKLETYLPDDPTIIAAYDNQLLPDVNFGAYYHNSDKYFLALSVMNLIQTKTDINNITNKVKNNFVRNYYLMAAYNVEVNKDFIVQPNVMVQAIEALPMQVDINTRLLLQGKYWVGLSYRLQDAIVGMFGMKFNSLEFSYSYDMTMSNIKTYSNGSHEIHLIYRLEKQNGLKSRKSGNNFF